jgi:hypothetical protein
MKQFFPLWNSALRLWLLVLGVVAGASLLPGTAEASHIRAGDIQARIDTTGRNLRRVFFKMTLYTDNSSNVDEDAVTIFFGDGTSSGPRGIRRDGGKRSIPGNTDTSLNIYYFEHIYPSSGDFTVHYIGENRNAGVLNMTDSQNQSFYISTTFTIQPSIGFNRSPVLSSPAIDRAGVSQVFLLPGFSVNRLPAGGRWHRRPAEPAFAPYQYPATGAVHQLPDAQRPGRDP